MGSFKSMHLGRKIPQHPTSAALKLYCNAGENIEIWPHIRSHRVSCAIAYRIIGLAEVSEHVKRKGQQHRGISFLPTIYGLDNCKTGCQPAEGLCPFQI